MSRGTGVAEVRAQLTDPRDLCAKLGLLEGYKPGRQAGGGLLIRCPAHNERTPSCSVRRGRDGTIAVHCFGCGFTGDALSLIAAVRGLDLRSDFAAILGEAASLAGVALDLHSPAAQRPTPAHAPALDYPDAAEVAALWASAGPIEDDASAARYLEGRAIDPSAVDLHQLARVLPAHALAPRWARCRGIPWPRSHRLLLPVVNYLGEVCSLRAWQIDGENSEAPKRTAPAGKALAGLLLACPTARRMLATGQAPWASKATPLDVLIVEGEPDFLTWATRCHEANGAPLAVLGIVAGSWCEAIAARIPDGSRVILRTHQDRSGDRYAAEIKASLAGRPVTILDLQRGASAKQPDDNERAQRGLLGDYFEGVTLETISEPEPPPASGTVSRLLSPEEGTAAIRAALRSPAPLAVIRSTTGAGKSAEQRAWLAAEATENKPAALFVPTHRLGEQTQAGLLSLGISSARPVGVGRVRLPVVQGEGAHACIHHEAADLLARAGGRVREELCPECPARKNHPSGGECPAYADGSTAAPIVVLQQPLLAPVLQQATDALTSSSTDKPPVALVVVDELPPLVARVPWDAAEQAHKLHLTAEMAPAALEALGPLLAAIRHQATAPLDRFRSLRELLDLAGADVDKTLAEARTFDGGALWQRSLPVRLARLSLAANTRGYALTRLTATAAFSELLRVLIEAAHEPDRPLLWPTESGPVLASLAPWVRQVRPFLAAGGRLRLLDATAPVDALHQLWPELELHSIEVRDAPQVRRQIKIWQHGARGRHCSSDRSLLADEVRGPLRRLAAAALKSNARKIGVLTHKPLADALRAWLVDREADPSKSTPAWCPDELRQLVDDGAEIIPGHFGAHRGLDLWAGCDLLATMGDPWPNLGAAVIEAGVLGLDAKAWTLETTRAELVQAWGRARAVHRDSPVLIVHFGASVLAPEPSWAPQWAGAPQEWPKRGRPPTVLPLTDPSTWAAERARLGLSCRDHARALGMSWATYCRKAPKGTAEAGTKTDPETPEKTVAHNPQEGVFDGVAGTPASSSSIPDYGPPDSCGFLPSKAPGGPAAPSPGEGGQSRPAPVVHFKGRQQERTACPLVAPDLVGVRWTSEAQEVGVVKGGREARVA